MNSLTLRSWFFALVGFIFLAGCQVTLAPAFDQAIVASIIQNTNLALRFFASVDGGTNPHDFQVRQDTYNTLIGAFESLELQARARPIPDGKVIKKINEMLETRGSNPLPGDYPSAFALGKIAETFTKMKKTDQANSLKPFAVEAFKGQVMIFLDQAIIYESFLKR